MKSQGGFNIIFYATAFQASPSGIMAGRQDRGNCLFPKF